MNPVSFLAGATLVALQAFPASAQVVDFVDHYDVAGHVGQVAVVTGPVAKVERMPDGALRVAVGASYSKRTVDVFIPSMMAQFFGKGDLFQHKGIQVRGMIVRDSTRSTVPIVMADENARIQVVDRGSVNVNPPPGLSSQEAGTLLLAKDSRWSLTVTPGMPFGGPAGDMKAKLLENGWTEEYCDFKKTTCHANPLIKRPSVAVTGTLGYQFSRMVQGHALFSMVPLGSAEGRHNGTDVRADWSTLLIGGSVAFSPIPLFYVGAGPVLAILNSERVDDQSRGVIRPGALFEAGIRSSAKSSMFVELNASYRMLSSRLEGPWPGRKDAAFVAAGPGTLNANFSHFFVSLGLGMRFANATR